MSHLHHSTKENTSLGLITNDARTQAKFVTNASPFIIKYRKVAQGAYIHMGFDIMVSQPHIVALHLHSYPRNKAAGKIPYGAHHSSQNRGQENVNVQ